MNYLKPSPKPEYDTTDYQAKAIEVASKMACMDGKCMAEGCGKTGLVHGVTLFAHHIIHRKYGNTATRVDNLFPVCLECHGKIHHNEKGFKAWLETKLPGLYDALWFIARAVCRLDWSEEYERLLLEYKQRLEEKAANERGI